ncbi:hypothetical protein M3B90_08295 [Dermabacter sp. p3-SID358]|uniref:hypothetical protein n=1 Tax=Dermabacter sp. p3-SID358 TaxID=2916114 RepID=UPI0021A543A6|nr:hypothetical protein [Dermabacter sp. p3-SID358]MCT1867525.1 hypothetical protein [Dermabacter sp. p3-SID358]
MSHALTATHEVLAFGQLLADSSSGSEDGSVAVIAAPFVLAFVVFTSIYSFFYLRYRNTDKKYRFEQETRIGVSNVQAFDHAGARRNGVKSTTMSGRNNGNPRQRVRRISI